MASRPISRVQESDANVMFFQHQISLAMPGSNAPGDSQFLSFEEREFFAHLFSRDAAGLEADFCYMIDRGELFYDNVREKIKALLKTWDAVIESKRRYNYLDINSIDRNFMRAFVLATRLIPDRVNWGYNQPELPQYKNNVLSRIPNRLPDNLGCVRTDGLAAEGGIPDNLPGYDEFLLLNNHPDALALSPEQVTGSLVKQEPREADELSFSTEGSQSCSDDCTELDYEPTVLEPHDGRAERDAVSLPSGEPADIANAGIERPWNSLLIGNPSKLEPKATALIDPYAHPWRHGWTNPALAATHMVPQHINKRPLTSADHSAEDGSRFKTARRTPAAAKPTSE